MTRSWYDACNISDRKDPTMPALYQYLITLHGETIDACYSIPDAFDMCDDYAADVWAGRLPDLLTADDFASPAACRAAFGVIACYDDGTTVTLIPVRPHAGRTGIGHTPRLD